MFIHDFSAWTWQNMVIRILVSMLVGGIIGLDRGRKNRGAGTKTITVVCLGSTLVMLTEQYIQVQMPGLADMTRMAAQVISGVGFIGVGTIMISNHQVKGLTTAATLWTSACLGLAIGIGFIDGALLITMMLLVSLHILPYVEQYISKKSVYSSMLIDIDKAQYLRPILQELKTNEIQLDSMEIMKPKLKGQSITVYMVIKCPRAMKHSEIYDIIMKAENVNAIDFL